MTEASSSQHDEQRKRTGTPQFPAIGLRNRIIDALDVLATAGRDAATPSAGLTAISRTLGQYPGWAPSALINPVSEYLRQCTGADWVWIGTRARLVIAELAGTGCQVDIPRPVGIWLTVERRREAS